MKTFDKKPPRKPYKPPVLERFGDIRKLTKNLTGMGMNDPGSSSGTKTG